MAITRDQIARRVRLARIGSGLTQAQVAKELGVHRPAISEIEAGRRAVSAEELHDLSRLFEVPVSTLLDGKGEEGRRASPKGGAPRSSTSIEPMIERMASVIVERFDPERIILFGSHARGTADRDSDVDLLIVMDVGERKRQKAIEIGVALHHFPIAMDIIVTNAADFERRKDIVGTIERPAAREGRVLYARD